jgi:hypothetical protein
MPRISQFGCLQAGQLNGVSQRTRCLSPVAGQVGGKPCGPAREGLLQRLKAACVSPLPQRFLASVVVRCWRQGGSCPKVTRALGLPAENHGVGCRRTFGQGVQKSVEQIAGTAFSLVSSTSSAAGPRPPGEGAAKGCRARAFTRCDPSRKQHRKTGVRFCSPQSVNEDGRSSGGIEMGRLLATIGVTLAIGVLIAATWPIGTEYVAGIALNALD